MSFAKKFCAKSPFKKSQADTTLVEGARSATEKIENPLEGAQQTLSMASNVASSFSKKSCYKKAKGIDGKACWKGFGIPKNGPKTKMKGGKRVDNCKPL